MEPQAMAVVAFEQGILSIDAAIIRAAKLMAHGIDPEVEAADVNVAVILASADSYASGGHMLR
jgi:hypothetical protein